MRLLLVLAACAAVLSLGACVTEPAPDEPKVYGHIKDPEAKPVRARAPKRQETITEVAGAR